jgi:hypothetical protein
MFGSRDSNGSTGRDTNGNANGSGRRGNRQGASRSHFFKKLLPGQWKSRNHSDLEEKLQNLPEGMREQVWDALP